VSEPDLSMPLTGLQELMADAVAGRVLDRIAPGNGPMIVPEWAAALFGRWAEVGGCWTWRTVLPAPYGSVLGIEVQATARKTLSVQMDIDNSGRIWAGVLRGRSFGS
jgi:hypothetical protein